MHAAVWPSAWQVRAVKRFRNGFITDPLCLAPWNTIRDVQDQKLKCGFGGFPITEDGSLGSRLIGAGLPHATHCACG